MDDETHIAVLAGAGLTQSAVGCLERHGIETVGQLRAAIESGQKVPGLAGTRQREALRALERFDAGLVQENGADPTPEEIERMCAGIQRSWTPGRWKE